MSTKLIIIGIITLSIISCKPKQTATETTDRNVPNDTELTHDEPRDSTSILEINISERNNMQDIGDTYTIINAEIIEDVLWLKVSYGGGCKEHFFELLFDNAYTESMEPAIYLTLKHNGNEDHCRSIVQQNIRFNLATVRDKGISKLTIHLSGWENPLVYNYGN